MSKENKKREVDQRNVHLYSASTINPFSLVESVLGKNIDWNTFEDQTQALCNILNIPKNELFSGRCPILTPHIDIRQNGNLVNLTNEDARIRLEQYLNKHTKRRITKKPPIRSITLKTLRDRIPDILAPVDKNPELDPRYIDSISQQLKRPRPSPALLDREWNPEGLEWCDMGEFFKEAPYFEDPIQGNIGDCYLIAAMSSIAWTRPYAFFNQTSSHYPGNKTSPLHKIEFHKDGKQTTMEITEKVPVKSNSGSKYWVYAKSSTPGETWVAVIEKAYAKLRSGTKTDCPNMEKLNTGVAAETCSHIIGGKGHWFNHRNKSNTESVILKKIKENCNGKKAINPMFALTPGSEMLPPALDYAAANIFPFHFYSILGWDTSGNKTYIVLRNPWGRAPATLNVLKTRWDYDNNRNTNSIPYNQNGIFAIEIKTYHQYFLETSFVTSD